MRELFLVEKSSWQERLLCLSELKKDYCRGGKLTENPKFCLFTLSVRKGRSGWGEEKCSEGLFWLFIIFSFSSVNKVFYFIYFKVLALLCISPDPYLTEVNEWIKPLQWLWKGQAIFDSKTLGQTRVRSAKITILFYNLQAGRPCSHSNKEALKATLMPGDMWTSQDRVFLVWKQCSRISGSPTKELESRVQASYHIQKDKVTKLVAK